MNLNHSTRIPELLELLRARTTFLERILAHSETFSAISGGMVSSNAGLEPWLLKRERLFRTYELAEKRIDWASRQILESGEELPPLFRKSIENEMTRTSRLIEKIQRADEGVVSNIQAQQERILREVVESRILGDRLGKFKSERMPVLGEEFDAKG
jgi:hypothetical protein